MFSQRQGMKSVLVVLCLLLLGAFTFCTGKTVSAATKKNTLVEVKPTSAEAAEGYTVRYKYYNSKGKITKKAWAKVKVDGVKVKMYFGADGKAYQAPSNSMFYDNVKTYKIGKKIYGFDTKGRMLTGFVATAGFVNNQYYWFANSGKVSTSKSKKLVKAITKGLENSTDTLVKLLGKPSSVKAVDICAGEDWTGEIWTYSDLFQCQVKKNAKTGQSLLLAVSAAQVGI